MIQAVDLFFYPRLAVETAALAYVAVTVHRGPRCQEKFDGSICQMLRGAWGSAPLRSSVMLTIPSWQQKKFGCCAKRKGNSAASLPEPLS